MKDMTIIVILLIVGFFNKKGKGDAKLVKEKFYLEAIDREILVANSNIKKPYISNYNNRDFEKGFSSEKDMIALHTISEMVGGNVTFALGQAPEFDKLKYSRIIVVILGFNSEYFLKIELSLCPFTYLKT